MSLAGLYCSDWSSSLQPKNRLLACDLIVLALISRIVFKGQGHPRTGHEGPEGELRYRSTLSSTSALGESGWLTPRPGRFTPGKETRYPLYRRVGGLKDRSE